MDTFAKRLRAAREAAQLGMNELGKLAGMGQGTISRFESSDRGKRLPDSTARRLAAALGVRYEWLVNGEEPMRPVRIEDDFEDPIPERAEAARFARVNQLPRVEEAIAQVRATQRKSTRRLSAEEWYDEIKTTSRRLDDEPLGQPLDDSDDMGSPPFGR